MTPQELADLHARALDRGTPWSPQAFANHMDKSGAVLVSAHFGFAVGQVVLDEVELFQIATAPEHRRKGVGRKLLRDFEIAALDLGAVSGFLEVAEPNAAARGLYQAAGWQISGRRKGYYPDPEKGRVDALILTKQLCPKQGAAFES